MEKKSEIVVLAVWSLFIGIAAAILAPKSVSGAELDWNMGSIVKRVSANEKEILLLKAEISKFKGEPCNCSETGTCLCDPDKCKCEDCPDHKLTKESFTSKFLGKENSNGRRVVIDSAPDCINCVSLKKQLGGVAENISINEYPSIESSPHEGLPYAHLYENGDLVLRLHYTSCNAGQIKSFLNGEKSTTKRTNNTATSRTINRQPTISRQVQRLASRQWTYPGRIEDHIREHGINPAGWSRSQLEQIHANLHETGRSGIIGQSQSRTIQYSQPSYQPQVYWGNTSASFCPSCVR